MVCKLGPVLPWGGETDRAARGDFEAIMGFPVEELRDRMRDEVRCTARLQIAGSLDGCAEGANVKDSKWAYAREDGEFVFDEDGERLGFVVGASETDAKALAAEESSLCFGDAPQAPVMVVYEMIPRWRGVPITKKGEALGGDDHEPDEFERLAWTAVSGGYPLTDRAQAIVDALEAADEEETI